VLAKIWLKSHRNIFFPLLAFSVPCLLRAIPEVLMWPYVTGFDTMAYYVPNTIIWIRDGINLWGFVSIGPLFYTILVSIVAAGAPLILTLKVFSPLLLGFMGLSLYLLAQRGLNWSPIKSTATAFIGTLYFVALRVSWDLLRNELGLIFFIITLALLSKKKYTSLNHYALLSFLMLMVVLSHQLVAVIMLGTIALAVALDLVRKRSRAAVNLAAASLPSAVFFVIFYFFSVPPSGFIDYSTDAGAPLASWIGFPSYQSMLLSEAGFFLYCYLPLLPLALFGFKKLDSFQLKSWFLIVLVLSIIPFAFVSNFRWILMLTYPLAFCVVEACSRLKSFKWKYSRIAVHKLAIAYVILSTVVLSFGFMIFSPEKPSLYFNSGAINSYSYQIPTSLLQNTLSISDCKHTVDSLLWLNAKMNSSSILLTHRAFYGWATTTIDNGQIVNYEFGDPANAARTISSENGSLQIYLIWWTEGQGWYGMPTVPLLFKEVYHSERIAIYSYMPG